MLDVVLVVTTQPCGAGGVEINLFAQDITIGRRPQDTKGAPQRTGMIYCSNVSKSRRPPGRPSLQRCSQGRSGALGPGGEERMGVGGTAATL